MNDPRSLFCRAGVLLCALVIASCGGGGGAGDGADHSSPPAAGGNAGDGEESPAPDTRAPAVVSVSPADGQTGIAPATVIAVEFDEPMQAESLDEGIQLWNSRGLRVPASVTYDAASNVASVSPERILGLATEYEVQVLPIARDLAGNGVETAHRASFTTRDGTWSAVGDFPATAYWRDTTWDSAVPRVLVTANDELLAAWLQEEPTEQPEFSFAGARFVDGAWQRAESISWVGTPPYWSFDWDADAEGNVLAVWIQNRVVGDEVSRIDRSVHTTGIVMANRYVAEPPELYDGPPGWPLDGWPEHPRLGGLFLSWEGMRGHYVGPGRPEGEKAHGHAPTIAVHPDGDAQAAWICEYPRYSGALHVCARSYDAESDAWQFSIEQILSLEDVKLGQDLTRGFRLDVVPLGNDAALLVLATGLDSTSGRLPELWTISWTSADGWGAPRRHDQGVAAGLPLYPVAGTDAAGNLMLVWGQPGPDGSEFLPSTFMQRRLADGTWEAPQRIGGYVLDRQAVLVVDPLGNALLVGPQMGPEPMLVAHRYVAGEGWKKTQVLQHGTTVNLAMAMDASGNALLAWEGAAAEGEAILGWRYTASGWEGPQLLDSGTLVGDVEFVDVAVDSRGRGMMVWTNKGRIRYSRFE